MGGLFRSRLIGRFPRHILKEYCRPADLAAASPIFLFVGAGFIGGEAAAFGISSFPPDLKVTSMNLQSRA
jgi:hypothetical protein